MAHEIDSETRLRQGLSRDSGPTQTVTAVGRGLSIIALTLAFAACPAASRVEEDTTDAQRPDASVDDVPSDTSVADVPDDTSVQDVPDDTSVEDVPDDTSVEDVSDDTTVPDDGTPGDAAPTDDSATDTETVLDEDLPGNTCALPLELDATGAAPFVASGNMAGAENAFSAPPPSCDAPPCDVCGSANAHELESVDEVWRFVAPATDFYKVELWGAAETFYVVKSCDDPAGTCWVGPPRDPHRSDVIWLWSDQEVFIVVEADPDATELDYTLRVCPSGTCWGDGLAAPLTFAPASLGLTMPVFPPLEFTNTLAYDPGDCPGPAAAAGHDTAEVVFAFTPMLDGVYPIYAGHFFELFPSNYITLNPPLYVLEESEAGGVRCIAATHPPFWTDYGSNTVRVPLTAGKTYYLAVELHGEGIETISLDLQIVQPCIPDCDDGAAACGDDGCGASCGECAADHAWCNEETRQCEDASANVGDSCTNPLTVGALPFTAEGDTSGRNNVYGRDGGYPDYGSASSTDEVWSLVPSASGTYDITVTPSGALEPILYVTSRCDDLVAGRLGSDRALSGSPASVSVKLLEGRAYRIIVDGQADSAGAYTLTVTGESAPPATVVSVRDGSIPSGTTVALSGVVVTGVEKQHTHTTFWVMDPSAPAPYNGVGVYGYYAYPPGLEVGATVDLVARVSGSTALDAATIAVTGAGASPQPLTGIDIATLTGAGDASPYSGVLVELSDVRVIERTTSYFRVGTDDASLFVSTFLAPEPPAWPGDCLKQLRGISTGSWLLQRTLDDHEIGGSCP
ncbi:MAG: hypothetical protein EP329_00340 [Deltaproteobacteria bacterium]|nr:MAG: hypothetical protein EP329_00340 [Deltaproteobacteria bacterium]